jgi:hypothetical protein
MWRDFTRRPKVQASTIFVKPATVNDWTDKGVNYGPLNDDRREKETL